VVQNSHGPHPQVFREPEGAELLGHARRRSPQTRELANSLRLSTEEPSQDLSGAWVTVRG
jgi:hypothetical protein